MVKNTNTLFLLLSFALSYSCATRHLQMNTTMDNTGDMDMETTGDMEMDGDMDHKDHTGHDHTPKAEDEDGHAGHLSGSASAAGHGLFFVTGTDAIVLFEGFTTSNWGEYIGACLFTIFLGILVEFITTFRMLYPHQQVLTSTGFLSAETPQASATRVGTKKENGIRVHMIKSIMYFIGVTLAYALMLIVMTFNVGLFFSAVLGLTIGYMFFGMARSRVDGGNDAADCCSSIA